MVAMLPRLRKKCPKCGDITYIRKQRKWYMRIIPGSKYYRCNTCGFNFELNFCVKIILMPIIIPFRFVIWALWYPSGLSFFWKKIRSPMARSEEEKWKILNQT